LGIKLEGRGILFG